MIAQAPLFQSFFMAGFEASSHRRRDGRRLDLIASTRHDRHAFEDYGRCAQLGISTLRDGLRWHLIETSPGVYDWSSWLPMLRAAREAGVQVIWDLFHYGHPDFYEPASPTFVDAFARFCAAAAQVHRDEMDAAPLFCPANEISFFAWSVDEGYFPSGGFQKKGECKLQMVRAAVAGAEAVLAVESRARFMWAEPLIHIAPRNRRSSERLRAERHRAAQYEAYDMLTGRTCPELGGRRDLVDGVGLNFYPHNQWYYRGPTIPMGHHEYRSLADMLVEAAIRFDKPLFLAETGAEGSGRPSWLHYVCNEVREAQARRARIDGVCLYPVTAYPGWDNARHCDVGLFSKPDKTGQRELHHPLAFELERQRQLFRVRETGPARIANG